MLRCMPKPRDPKDLQSTRVFLTFFWRKNKLKSDFYLKVSVQLFNLTKYFIESNNNKQVSFTCLVINDLVTKR